jgi:hypothetical protein
VLLGAVAGCGGDGLGAEVSGVVTLDGKPVGPGVVVFAQPGGGSYPAEGAIQPDGSYFLKTSREIGLAPGRYQVALTVLEDPEIAPGERSMTPSKRVTPEKYSSHETSGLEFDVAEGDNTINLELTSK